MNGTAPPGSRLASDATLGARLHGTPRPCPRDTRRAELASDLWEHEVRRAAHGPRLVSGQHPVISAAAGGDAGRSVVATPARRSRTFVRGPGASAGSSAAVALGLSGPRAPLRHQATPEQTRRRRNLLCVRTLQSREIAAGGTSRPLDVWIRTQLKRTSAQNNTTPFARFRSTNVWVFLRVRLVLRRVGFVLHVGRSLRPRRPCCLLR